MCLQQLKHIRVNATVRDVFWSDAANRPEPREAALFTSYLESLFDDCVNTGRHN